MSLTEFIQQHNGQFVNYDTVYGPQCMDLYRQYVKDVLGFPQSPGVSIAAQVWYQAHPHFDKIACVLGRYPVEGDIVIWQWRYGGTGHVAIVIKANAVGLTCFSQNDPLRSPSIIKEYSSYKYVLGWLHPKVSSTHAVPMPIVTR